MESQFYLSKDPAAFAKVILAINLSYFNCIIIVIIFKGSCTCCCPKYVNEFIVMSIDRSTEIGRLGRKYYGFVSEAFTKADRYSINCNALILYIFEFKLYLITMMTYRLKYSIIIYRLIYNFTLYTSFFYY
jgi:hypothetical protein